MSDDVLPPPPPWSTVAESFDYYAKALTHEPDEIKKQHELFFYAGAVSAHTTIMFGQDEFEHTVAAVTSFVNDKKFIESELLDMAITFQEERSSDLIGGGMELHAFYSGAATFLGLLNRAREAGFAELQREIVDLTVALGALPGDDEKSSRATRAH